MILFFQLKHLQKIWLWNKKPQVKITSRSKVMSAVLFFHCDVISYKLSKLSCIILYYIEIKASLYLATFFVDLLENWYKMRKIIVYNWNFRILVKYLEEGVKRGPSLTLSWRRPLSYRNLSIDLLQLLLQILQSSFKAIYRYQTAMESSNLGTM